MLFLFKTLKQLIRHRKYNKIINTVYEEEEVIAKISTLLGVQFRRDWVNRLYAVINPNIKDGKYDPEQIVEFDFDGNPNNTEWVTKWIAERYQILLSFVSSKNLFEILQYNIQPLGGLNYLVTFTPITLPPLLKYAKYALLELCVIIPAIFYACCKLL